MFILYTRYVMWCYVMLYISYTYIYIYVIFFCQCPGETKAYSTSIHSWKGVFCIKERIRHETVLIHTGGVDAMWWRLSKSAIPCSLATRVNSQVNPKCEASGSGNGNGWTPRQKTFWRSLVALCRRAWPCERRKTPREFGQTNFP